MKDNIDHEANRRQEVKDKRDDLLFGIEFEIITALKLIESEHPFINNRKIDKLTKSLMSKIKEL